MVASQTSSALIHINKNQPFDILLAAFNNPSLRAFIQSQIGGYIPRGQDLKDSDFVQVIMKDGTNRYQIRREVAERVWKAFNFVGQLVISAAFGIHHPERVMSFPAKLPKDLLGAEWARPVISNIQSHSHFPHATLANPSHNDNLLKASWSQRELA
ncbi:hypothetical protein MPER_07839, partial [Moniliophthora perniciosa FA553]